jgi:hypothetical protein
MNPQTKNSIMRMKNLFNQKSNRVPKTPAVKVTPLAAAAKAKLRNMK